LRRLTDETATLRTPSGIARELFVAFAASLQPNPRPFSPGISAASETARE
jgi:hypothetical protein